MSSKLDMTLDQLVKMDKSTSSGNKRNLRPKRNNPIQRPRANQAPRRDLQTRGARSGPSSGAESSAKINISNLNNNVTSNDLRDIFSKVGPIRSAHINFRENGTSAGTGSVIFKLSGDALTAFKRYHNVKLDGTIYN
jgi:THO complex subunit 4